ncbi:MAG: hypothetical protein JXB30_03510 [Anaerolineae bacterium]|nr:hypothetical protein [Anaerolineae bacterium]
MMNLSSSLDDRLESCLAALDAGASLESVLSDLTDDDRAELEPLLRLTTAVRILPDPAMAQPRPDLDPTLVSVPVRRQKRRWSFWQPGERGRLNFGLLFGSVYATGLAVAMIAVLLGVILLPRLLPGVTQVASPGFLGRPTRQKPTQTSVLIASTPGMAPELETHYGVGDAPNPAIARLGVGLPRQIALSPDGTMLAVGASTGVYVYDTTTMDQLWSESTYAAVEEIRWSADSRRVAARLHKWPNLLVWNSATGEYVRSLEYSGEVLSMAWSPDRVYMAGGFYMPDPEGDGGYAYGVAIWQVDTGEVVVETVLGTESQVLPIEGDEPKMPTGLDWSPTGDLLAVVVGERSVALIDPASGDIDKIVRTEAGGEPFHVAFSPDGQWLAGYAESSTQVTVWQVETGERAYELEHDALAAGLSWSPDGRHLATTTYAHLQTRVWDMTNGAMVVSMTAAAQDFGVFGWFDSLAWAPDGKHFITTGQNSGAIVQWDVATGTATTMGFEFPDLASYSPEAYVGSAPDGSLIIWDSAQGVPLYNYRFAPPPEQVGWSPDQTQIAGVAADSSTVVWGIERALPMEFLDDPQLIGGWLTGEVDPRGWGCWDTVTAHNDRERLTASAISTVDASGGSAATVDIIDGDTSAAIYKWTVQGSSVCALAFSPGGKWLAIGQGSPSDVTDMRESAITILDMETGEVYDVLYGHTGSVQGLVWSADGTRLASVSVDGSIVVWGVGE